MWMNVALFAVHTCQHLWVTPVASICRQGVSGTRQWQYSCRRPVNQNTLSWCVLRLRYPSLLTVLQLFIEYSTKLQLPFFGSGCAHVRNFQNVSPQQSPLPEHLWVCHRQCRDLLDITGVMVHFRYYKKKQSRYCPAWTHPCTDRSEIELASVSMQHRVPAKCHPDWSTYGRMAADKPVFDV